MPLPGVAFGGFTKPIPLRIGSAASPKACGVRKKYSPKSSTGLDFQAKSLYANSIGQKVNLSIALKTFMTDT